MPKTMSDYLSPAGARAALAQEVHMSDRAFNAMQKGLYDYNVNKSRKVGQAGMAGGAGGYGLSWLFQKLFPKVLGPFGPLLDLGLTALGNLGGKQYAESQFGPPPEIRSSDIKFGETSLVQTEMAQEEQEGQYDDWSQFWDSLGFGVKALMMKSMLGGEGSLFSKVKSKIPVTPENVDYLYHGDPIMSSAMTGKTIADITAGIIGASPWFLPSDPDRYEEEEEEEEEEDYREGKSYYSSPSYT